MRLAVTLPFNQQLPSIYAAGSRSVVFRQKDYRLSATALENGANAGIFWIEVPFPRRHTTAGQHRKSTKNRRRSDDRILARDNGRTKTFKISDYTKPFPLSNGRAPGQL